MNYADVIGILNNEKTPTITVFGDFCLDKYIYIDSEKYELSVETGLQAYQVVDKRAYAGAGGTITNNLCALGAKVICVGVVGDDGEGYELMKCLNNVGADTSYMVRTEERSTCMYLKPMKQYEDKSIEMNRYDYKNFTHTPSNIEIELISNLRKALAYSDAVIVCDQHEEADCAAVTSNVRSKLINIAKQNKDTIFYVDSRAYIDKFDGCIIKCNESELARVSNIKNSFADMNTAVPFVEALYDKTGKPVYITFGWRGSLLFDGKAHTIPPFKVTGELDIVGAGDACNAGIVFALSKGADYRQAGIVGNAAASLVVRQTGVSGKAPIAKVVELLNQVV